MALFSRSGETSEAVYARVLDGAHLWLAVRGSEPLSLVGDGVDLAVVTESRDGVLTAVVDLAPLGSEATLMSGRSPVAFAAPGGDPSVTADPGGFEVADVDGALVVRRVQPSGVEIGALLATDDGVEVALTGVASVALQVKDRVLAELPVTDGRLVLGALPTLPAGPTATFRTPSGPLVRARNVLVRPNYAVLLPPMIEPDVTLRWLKDGRLAVQRADA